MSMSSSEKKINYSEMTGKLQSFAEVTTFLDNATANNNEIKLSTSKVQGKTAEQALCGFKSILTKAVGDVEKLTSCSKTFFTSLGVQFETADESMSKKISE